MATVKVRKFGSGGWGWYCKDFDCVMGIHYSGKWEAVFRSAFMHAIRFHAHQAA